MSEEYVIEELEWLIANNDWVQKPEGTQDQNSINALKEAIELLNNQKELIKWLDKMLDSLHANDLTMEQIVIKEIYKEVLGFVRKS